MDNIEMSTEGIKEFLLGKDAYTNIKSYSNLFFGIEKSFLDNVIQKCEGDAKSLTKKLNPAQSALKSGISKMDKLSTTGDKYFLIKGMNIKSSVRKHIEKTESKSQFLDFYKEEVNESKENLQKHKKELDPAVYSAWNKLLNDALSNIKKYYVIFFKSITTKKKVSTEDLEISIEGMVINPYQTSFGSMINRKPIVEGLTKYLVNSDLNLNYEYSNADDCKLVFITGINADEKDLPLWEHPILFEDHKGNKIVATDMRKYIKLAGDEINTLQSIVKDKGGYDYMLLRAMVMSDMASEVYGSFTVIEKSIVLAFSYWLADSINSVVLLNPLEKSRLEVIIAHYANMLMVNGDIDNSAVETSKVKISKSKISIPMNVKMVGEIVDKLKHDVNDIDDLVANIKDGLDSPKADMIDSNTLVNMVASSWFGPGGSESVMMAMESMPTWIAMLYSSSSNKSYKRSRLATILEKHGRKFDIKELNKTMELYIKDRTLG